MCTKWVNPVHFFRKLEIGFTQGGCLYMWITHVKLTTYSLTLPKLCTDKTTFVQNFQGAGGFIEPNDKRA